MSVNYGLRNIIKQIVYKTFHRDFKKLFSSYDEEFNINIATLFSDYFITYLSLSLIEGYKIQESMYLKILKESKIKFIHTSNGILTSDYFKIFSIVGKRFGCSIVSHEHGVFNYLPIMPLDNKITSFYKIHDTLRCSDFFIAWSNRKNMDIYKNVEKNLDVKILNIGSVYLNMLTKKSISNDVDLNTILYLDSPIRKYRISEIEDSYENLYSRKIQICNLFKNIIKSNPKIKIIYKPFPYNYPANPINDLINILPAENFIINKNNSIDQMRKTNLIISDSLSTAFAESILLKKNMLIFGNEFEYNNSSIEGKKINDLLFNDEILFYKTDKLLNKIKYILNKKNNIKFQLITSRVEFLNSAAHPISREDFLNKISNLI